MIYWRDKHAESEYLFSSSKERRNYCYYYHYSYSQFISARLKKLRKIKNTMTNYHSQGKVNPLTTNVSHHIDPSQIICFANQLTGFYMMRSTGR